MGLTISSASRKDINGLLELWKEFMKDPTSLDRSIPTHSENVGRWKEFIGKLIDEDPMQVLVAKQDDSLVGYLICERDVVTPLDMGYRWSYVSDIYVKPAHRRQGVGRLLLQTILEYLRSVGSTHVRLAVWDKNERAIKLYRELGFRDHMHILQVNLQLPVSTASS